MKINITKKEYRLLIEMLYLSDWMMTAHEVDSKFPEHDELRKKLLSISKEMGADDVIEYSQEQDSYFETSEYDNYIHTNYIAPYNEGVFWNELIDRLAERDVIKRIGVDQAKKMDRIELFEKIDELRQRYGTEFEHHGLDNVIIGYGIKS